MIVGRIFQQFHWYTSYNIFLKHCFQEIWVPSFKQGANYVANYKINALDSLRCQNKCYFSLSKKKVKHKSY
jgi:hypothetical protein